MDLLDYRQQIDDIDAQLVELFRRRMEICVKIAEYKREQGLPVFHPQREQEKLRTVAALAGPQLAEEAQILYTTLFELSRNRQNRLVGGAFCPGPSTARPENDTEVIG